MLFSVRVQVLYHCDVAQWMKFCLEHSDSNPHVRYSRLETASGERMYGEPCTSKWQEEMEALVFPRGLPDGVDIVGCMHAFDVQDVQPGTSAQGLKPATRKPVLSCIYDRALTCADGSRKSGNFYGSPAGLSKDLRGHADVWPPIAYLPNWKHPETDGERLPAHIWCHPTGPHRHHTRWLAALALAPC
jgi:hypothetical protein